MPLNICGWWSLKAQITPTCWSWAWSQNSWRSDFLVAWWCLPTHKKRHRRFWKAHGSNDQALSKLLCSQKRSEGIFPVLFIYYLTLQPFKSDLKILNLILGLGKVIWCSACGAGLRRGVGGQDRTALSLSLKVKEARTGWGPFEETVSPMSQFGMT